MIQIVLPWLFGTGAAALAHAVGYNPGQGAGIALVIFGMSLFGASS